MIGQDLMAAVAAQGFRELTQAMMEATRQRTDAIDRLKRPGLGYVTFALRRPEHFAVMFDASISKHKHPDSAAAAEQAFGTLMSFAKGGQDAGRLPSGDLRQMALLAWTMVHGIAKLAITGRLPFPSSAEVLKFAERWADCRKEARPKGHHVLCLCRIHRTPCCPSASFSSESVIQGFAAQTSGSRGEHGAVVSEPSEVIVQVLIHFPVTNVAFGRLRRSG
jgi:hypothetical protein